MSLDFSKARYVGEYKEDNAAEEAPAIDFSQAKYVGEYKEEEAPRLPDRTPQYDEYGTDITPERKAKRREEIGVDIGKGVGPMRADAYRTNYASIANLPGGTQRKIAESNSALAPVAQRVQSDDPLSSQIQTTPEGVSAKALFRAKNGPVDTPQPELTLGDAFSDPFWQFAVGANNIVGSPFSAVAPDSTPAQYFKRSADMLRNNYSPALQHKELAAKKKIDAAREKDGEWGGFTSSLKEYGTDPALSGMIMFETLPSMLGVIGPMRAAQVYSAARGLSPAAAASLASTTGGISNAVMNGGAARQEAYDTLLDVYTKSGMQPDEAKEAALKDSLLTLTVGALTGGIGGKYGGEAAVMGLGAAGNAIGRGGAKAAVKAGAGAVLREVTTEQGEEVLPQVVTNSLASEHDGRSPFDGIGEIAAKTLIGTGPLAGMGAASEAGRAYDSIGTALQDFADVVEGTELVSDPGQVAADRLSPAWAQMTSRAPYQSPEQVLTDIINGSPFALPDPGAPMQEAPAYAAASSEAPAATATAAAPPLSVEADAPVSPMQPMGEADAVEAGQLDQQTLLDQIERQVFGDSGEQDGRQDQVSGDSRGDDAAGSGATVDGLPAVPLAGEGATGTGTAANVAGAAMGVPGQPGATLTPPVITVTPRKDGTAVVSGEGAQEAVAQIVPKASMVQRADGSVLVGATYAPAVQQAIQSMQTSNQPTATSVLQQTPVSLPIPQEIQRRMAKRTDAELDVIEKTAKDPVTKSAAKKEKQSRAAPIMLRDDLVGAIMRITGGRGINPDMALTLTGDKANHQPRLRGLFKKGGTADMSDLAELLRIEQGYDVRDGTHLEELIREQAAGNPVYSMERNEREAAENEERKYRDEINKRAVELGLKQARGKRTLEMVEADIARVEQEQNDMEAREERAAIQAESAASEAFVDEGAPMTEDDFRRYYEQAAEIEYTQEDFDRAEEYRTNREDARTAEDAFDAAEREAQSRSGERNQDGQAEEGARGTAESAAQDFQLNTYTESELAAREAAEQARAEAEQAATAKAEKEKQDRQLAQEVKRRSEAAAGTFELGQDAMENVSGQGGLFDARAANPEMDALKAEMGQAIDELASILGVKTNLTPEEESRIIPVMSKIFRIAAKMGYIKFKDAAGYVMQQIRAMAGNGIADKLSIENLQAGYINIAKEIGGDKREAMAYDSIEELEKENVTDERSSTDLERDRTDAGTEDGVGQESVQTGRDVDGRTGRRGVEGAEGDARERGGERGGVDEAVSTGERSDQQIYAGAPEPGPGSAGSNVDLGSGDAGIAGLPVEPRAAERIADLATTDAKKLQTYLTQRGADKNAPTEQGIESVRQALPVLTPGQQEDVVKAEARFAAADGYGMLFTNGTGTGKTFTGLGVIKRFANQGKTNILVVAPNDKIIEDWQKSGKMLGLEISRLTNTSDAGQGVVITTYANLGSNDALARRDWDLVVSDEAHYLTMDKDGKPTTFINNMRAITLHPDGLYQRHSMLNRKDIERLKELSEEAKRQRMSDDERDWTRADATQAKADKLASELKAKQDAIKADIEARQGASRTRALFLSATPFAYEKTVDWANGYLFDYNEGRSDEGREFRGYNQGSNKDQFFMQHFGYRMRTGKLTEPDAKVDRGLMQRQFNSWLKKRGALSGRMLDVAADYDRRFILVDSGIGKRIDDALEWFEQSRKAHQSQFDDSEVGQRIAGIMGKTDPYVTALSAVRDHIGEKFDYLSRRYLLESIKAKEVVPHIREHLAMGRKVVVFHDYKKGGGFNPFILEHRKGGETEEQKAEVEAWNRVVDAFNREFSDIIHSDLFKQSSPIDMFRKEFPDVLLFNGDIPAKQRRSNVAKFQDDASGPQVILVQSAAGKEGISLHDTTGKHQRVLFNLGQPTQPTTAIQQEGRIYRTGQVTDAIFRYLNTGTRWEQWAFATTIAQRASAAENLGMGEMARALKDAFITGFEESGDYRAGMEGDGKGGKERDRMANEAISEYDRAKSFYFGQQKKTSATKAAEGADYFATPEPVGLKMVEFADIRPGESVLEPSAGHGAIARWVPDNAERTAVEPSMKLRPRLAMVFNGDIIGTDFESHNTINKYDAVVMNPPFGAGGKTAIEHLDKAAKHLRDGGRIVALIPTGPAADKRFEKWMYGTEERDVKPLMDHPTLGQIYRGDTIATRASWMPEGVVARRDKEGRLLLKREGVSGESTVSPEAFISVKATGPRTAEFRPADGLYMRMELKLPAVTFERAGTQVATRIVVIDKVLDKDAAPQNQSVFNQDITGITDIGELFDRIENMAVPQRAKPVEAEAESPASNRSDAKKQKDAARQEAMKAEEAAQEAGAIVPQNEATFEVKGDKLITNAPLREYTTKAGKLLKGVWVPDQATAKAVDAYTWKSRDFDGNYFVRIEHVQRPVVGSDAKLSASGEPAQGKPLTESDLLPLMGKAMGSETLAKVLLNSGLVTGVHGEGALKRLAGKSGSVMESEQGQIQGATLPDGRIILNLDALTADNFAGVFKHEGFHSTIRELLGDETYQKLMDRLIKNFELARGNDWVGKAWLAIPSDTKAKHVPEEIAAYAIEQVTNGAKVPGFIKRWVGELLSALRTAIIRFAKTDSQLQAWAMNNLKPEDLARLAVAGLRAKARGAMQGQMRDAVAYSKTALPDTIDVDGVERQTRNSNGKPIAQTEEGLRNFWRWFGDSKVVDEQGRPLVVYHGTKGNFDTFDAAKQGASDFGASGRGFYFSEDAGTAGAYAALAPSDGAPNVMPVYLAISNPLELGALLPQNEEQSRLLTDLAKSAGHDGIVVRGADGVIDEVIAFNPEQIKSATGNNGDFDGDNPDIRYSRAQPALPGSAQQQPARKPALPADTLARKAQRKIQDKLNRFTVIKKWLAENGVTLSEQADIHKAEERMHSRFANKAQDFREKRVMPLVQKVQKAGFTMEDVAQFLHANHAQARNAQIAKINPSLPDGGSGMTNAEAQAILKAAPAELKALALEFRAITEDTKQILLKAGVIDQDTVNAWEAAYGDTYVPLKGGPDENAAKIGNGKGLSLKHKQKRALGHETRAEGEWIIENILADHERALMAAEKNRVFHSLVKMALETAHLDLITINKPEKRQVLMNRTSYVVRKKGVDVASFQTDREARAFIQHDATVTGSSRGDYTTEKSNDPSVAMMASPMPGPDEATGYINGHLVRVQFNDPLMAEAYNNMGAEAMNAVFRAGRALNGFFSKVYTGYNPEFIFTNILRDFTTGLANVTGEEGVAMAAKSAKNYAGRFLDLAKYAATGNETKWVKMYREDGGNTGAAYLSDLERLGADLQTEYAAYQGVMKNLAEGNYLTAARAAGRKTVGKLLNVIEVINMAGENAMRLAVYQSMVESGKSRAEAASMAKNVTVNFNRKGTMGAHANAVFLFFNAGVQGTASMAHAHFKGKHKYQAWAFSSSLAGIGYLLSLMAAADDEDDYEKTSEFDRSRNMLIKTENGYVKIPIPYGYGFFWNLGRGLADAQRTGEIGKMPWHVAASFVEEFTPFGAVIAGREPDGAQAFHGALPTALQIPHGILYNKTSFGTPMRPESGFDRNQPDRDKMNRPTRGTIADDLAGALESAGMDVSPETLKYLWRTFTGGAGTTATSVFDAAKLKAQGAELDVKEMPFVRKVYTETDVRGARARYYEAKDEADKALAEFKRATKKGDTERADRVEKESEGLIEMSHLANAMNEEIKAARDRIDSVRLSGKYTKAEERMIIKQMEKEEAELYDDFMAQFKTAKKEMRNHAAQREAVAR